MIRNSERTLCDCMSGAAFDKRFCFEAERSLDSLECFVMLCDRQCTAGGDEHIQVDGIHRKDIGKVIPDGVSTRHDVIAEMHGDDFRAIQSLAVQCNHPLCSLADRYG